MEIIVKKLICLCAIFLCGVNVQSVHSMNFFKRFLNVRRYGAAQALKVDSGLKTSSELAALNKKRCQVCDELLQALKIGITQSALERLVKDGKDLGLDKPGSLMQFNRASERPVVLVDNEYVQSALQQLPGCLPFISDASVGSASDLMQSVRRAGICRHILQKLRIVGKSVFPIHVAKDDEHVVVALDAHAQDAGFVYLKLHRENDGAEVRVLKVEPQYVRCGVGSTLICSLFHFNQQFGAQSVFFCASAFGGMMPQSKLVAFYQSFGGRVIESTKKLCNMVWLPEYTSSGHKKWYSCLWGTV